VVQADAGGVMFSGPDRSLATWRGVLHFCQRAKDQAGSQSNSVKSQSNEKHVPLSKPNRRTISMSGGRPGEKTLRAQAQTNPASARAQVVL